MTPLRRSIFALTLGTLALLAVPRDATAQNALGDGRLLDRNLQQGSGGINQQAAPVNNGAVGNSIITGNVSGLGYFHGNAGYRAPGELRINLPSQTLFRFQAQSLNPGQLPQQDWRPANGQPMAVYRDYSSPSVMQGSTSRQLVPAAGINVSVPQTSSTLDTPDPSRTIGVSVQPDGRMLELRASPLMGLHVESNAGAQSDAPDPTRIEPIRITSSRGTNTYFSTQQAVDYSAPPVDAGAPRRATVTAQSATGPSLTVEQRIRQLQAAVYNPQGSATAQPGDDVYLDMLNKMREARDVAEGRAPRDPALQPGGRVAQVQPTPAPAPTDPGLTPEERAKLDAEARRVALGLPSNEDPEANKADADPAAELTDRDLRAMSELLHEFKRRMPPLPSLASKRDDRVNVLMRKAEQQVGTGKYLDAEQSYRQVLGWSPGNPLARVGLVHAQVGAGMIRTAELNLRSLLNENPLLIAVRYDRKLLPPEERLRWVRSQLDNMMAAPPDQRPTILLAYLGFQADQPELTRYALDMAQASNSRDPLIALLRRLWLPEDRK